MLCERYKIREASTQYTEAISGAGTKHHFCTRCVKKTDFGTYPAIFNGESPFAELLSGLLGAEVPTERQDRRQKIVCPACGLSYEEFVRNSYLSCADCYGVLDVLTNESIRQLQGSNCHRGERSVYQRGSAPEGKVEETAGVRSPMEEEMRSLEIRLQDTIRLEGCEIAAQYRDRIRESKQTMGIHENTEKGEGTNAQVI